MVTAKKKPNSNDVARHAKVSQATVSRVLSGSAPVNDSTRARVMKVINDLDFQLNPFAQAIRTNRSGTIGVVITRLSNPLFQEILQCLAGELRAEGYRMVVWNSDIEGEEGVIESVKQNFVDGIIFTAASHQWRAMDATLESGLPVVSINRHLDPPVCDQVVSHNYEGAKTIGDYLISSGRNRIAIINGPHDRTTLVDRERGLKDAIKDAGLSLPRAHYARLDFKHDAFSACAIKMLQGPTPPDAIACGNDVIAFAVLCGLKSIGVSVPNDVWVTGFDGVEMSGWEVFDLTTMKQRIDVMIVDAVKSLVSRIRDGREAEPTTIRRSTEFIVRGSTANAAASSEHVAKEGHRAKYN